MDLNLSPKYNSKDGIFLVDGMFFIDVATIKKNNVIAQQTLGDLYKYVSDN